MGNVPSSTTSLAATSTGASSSTVAAIASRAAYRSDGRCGKDYGGSACDPNGQYGGCCSQYGWCGKTDAYCLASNGCQSGCAGTSSKKATLTTTKTTTKSTTTSVKTTTKSTTSSTTTKSTTLSTTTKTSTTTSTSRTISSTTKASIASTQASSTTKSTTSSAPSSTFTMKANYNAANWVDSFTAQGIAGNDPTHGFVNYLDAASGQAAGIYKTVNNQVYIGVDNSTVLNPGGANGGRKSMRLNSKAAYNTGLFILDAAHVPGAACGSWPAFWLLGTGNWPTTGEIDVFEGVNRNTNNQMTLHTSPGCNVNVGSGGQTGTSGAATDCGADGGYNGCSVYSGSSNTYGDGFNAIGGGVYALHWTTSQIRVWFFPRSSSIPSDITAGAPNPNGWGKPQANFGGCNFASYMGSMNIMFNIDFCGDWADGVWGQGCAAYTNTNCTSYVGLNPHQFDQTYFLINSLKVYQ